MRWLIIDDEARRVAAHRQIEDIGIGCPTIRAVVSDAVTSGSLRMAYPTRFDELDRLPLDRLPGLQPLAKTGDDNVVARGMIILPYGDPLQRMVKPLAPSGPMTAIFATASGDTISTHDALSSGRRRSGGCALPTPKGMSDGNDDRRPAHRHTR